MSRPERERGTPTEGKVSDEEHARWLTSRGRKYLENIKSVATAAAIVSPDTGNSESGYGYEKFRFFIEAGFFCIESKKTGRVVDVPPSMIRHRVWFNEQELAKRETPV